MHNFKGLNKDHNDFKCGIHTYFIYPSVDTSFASIHKMQLNDCVSTLKSKRWQVLLAPNTNLGIKLTHRLVQKGSLDE